MSNSNGVNVRDPQQPSLATQLALGPDSATANQPSPPQADTRALAARLIRELRVAWARGERLLAEQFIAELPAGPSQENDAVDLIYAEYILREEQGEKIPADQLIARFPQYAAPLRRQLDLDALLAVTQPVSLPTKTDTRTTVDTHPLLRNKDFPATLGKYVLVAPLDRGGQAEVYLALHPVLRKEVVLKLSRYPLSADSAVAARLLEEGRIVAKLQHPFLARVYDLDLHEGYPFLVVEHIHGQSLDQYAQQNRLTPADAVRIVMQVSQAVATAHQHHVLHLDIKPKNIIVDDTGAPWLIDFGLARLNDAWSQAEPSSQVCGTLQFMAPEQAGRSTEKIGPAADVFALGGLLYFLLTKQTPYQGTDLPKLLKQIAAGEWDRAPLEDRAVPPPLRRICERAMAAKPADRYPSAAAFIEALRRYEQTGKRRAVLAGIGLAACLLTAFATWSLRGGPPETIEPTIALQAWNGSRYVPVADRLPLQGGDEVQVRCSVPPGKSATLLLLDSEGKWTELRRWPAAETARTLSYPDAEKTVPLTGAPGTELVLLVTHDKPNAQSTARLTSAATAQPIAPLSDYTIVELDAQGVRKQDFSKSFGPPLDRPDPEQQALEQLAALRARLERESAGYAGVAFRHD